MEICRIGLVGAGSVALRHATVLSGFPDVHVTAVTDVAPQAASALAGEVGARAVPDVQAVLAEGVDAVYVCVPPFAHGPAERVILEAGLPMFVEKPVAADLETAEELGRLVADAGVRTGVGHHWRYLAVVERARQLLDGRPVRLLAGSWLDKVPPVGWWPVRERSGGPLVEQAAHVVDLARHLAGEVTEVSAAGNGTPPPVADPAVQADVDGATAAVLRFASGAVGTLGTTSVLGWKQRAGLEIYADDLAIAVGEQGLVVRDGRDAAEERVEGDPDGARRAVDRAFVDAVRGIGDDVRVPYAEALRTHRVACSLAQSALTGRPVAVPVEEAARG